MAFILRVKADCSDSEVSAKLVGALSTMTSLQDVHPGVICYHFSRPEPGTRPLYFEFTEVYGNEGAFWGHSASAKFIEAYSSVFPSDKIASVTYGYGPMSEKVRGVCDTYLKCRYPQDTVGPILTRQKFDRESPNDGDGPLLVIGQIQAKDGKVDEILQLLTRLSAEANDGVVVCFANVPEKEKAPNDIDLLYLCTTNSHFVSHFGSEQGKTLLRQIRDSSNVVKMNGYGQVLPVSVESMAEVGIEVVARATDTGYVLHPNADPEGL